jgi:hypothetical protein
VHDVLAALTEYVPRAQLEHVEELFAPTARDILPGGHDVHEAVLAPSDAE